MQGSYYFKVSRTVDSTFYHYETNKPVAEFFRDIKQLIIRDSWNHHRFTQESDFEIVRAGQYSETIQFAEDAPAIDFSQLTGSVYRNFQNNESFYIRLLNPTCFIDNDATSAATSANATVIVTDTDAILPSVAVGVAVESSSISHLCSICYTRSDLQAFHGCGHLYCKSCYYQCRSNGFTCCSICRAQPL